MTTPLEGGERTASRPGRSLPSGRTRYPLYRRLGGPQGQSGQVRKISPPPRFDTRTVQRVASRCADYATRPTYQTVEVHKSLLYLYVLLTAHFSNIWFLVSNLMLLFIISFHIPLHVSSHIVLIIRRIYCIYTASGSLCVTLLVWPFGAQAVRVL